MKLRNILFSSLLAASPCYASPTPILDLSPMSSRDTELLINEGIKLARSLDLEKRVSADFSLDRSWNNEVLFGGAWNDTQPGSEEHAKLSVTCLECYTRGTVTAKVTDKHFLQPLLRVSLSGVEAKAFVGVSASAGQTFSLNLFSSNTPIGIGITGLDVGVVFFVDLVFSLDEAIDLSAGFQVSVPDGSYLEADIFKGDIDDSAFTGLNTQSLPITVVSGHATFKADLRLRVQAGAEASIDLFGIGAGAVVGIYANLIEFVATIDKSPTCDLEALIWWDINVGAYAHLDVVVDYTTLGPVPTVSTTLLAAAETFSSCLIDGPTAPALPATTSEAAASTPAYTPPVLSSSPAETGGVGVSSSVVATSAPATDSTLVWTPTFMLTVSTSEVSFSMPVPSPTDAASSLSGSDTSAAPITTATAAASSSLTKSAGSSPSSPSSVHYSSSVAAGHGQGAGTPPGSVSSVHISSSVAASSHGYSYSYEAGYPSASSSAYSSSSVAATGYATYSDSASSVYYSSSAAASYSHVAGTYPVSIPAVHSSSVAAAAPTYTSTYTHTMTICGAPGVMNCPATYQTKVVVTRTTTVCPATETTAVATVSAVSPKPTEVIVIVLTPLPTPVTATFVAPTVTETTTVHVDDYVEATGGLETTVATTTATTTITSIASHGVLPTPPVIAVPSPDADVDVDVDVSVPANTTVVGTGVVPRPTQSGPQTPVIAGAPALGSAYGVYVGAAMTFVAALFMGAL